MLQKFRRFSGTWKLHQAKADDSKLEKKWRLAVFVKCLQPQGGWQRGNQNPMWMHYLSVFKTLVHMYDKTLSCASLLVNPLLLGGSFVTQCWAVLEANSLPWNCTCKWFLQGYRHKSAHKHKHSTLGRTDCRSPQEALRCWGLIIG